MAPKLRTIGSFVVCVRDTYLNLARILHRYPNPRQEITKDILKRTFALCPELAPPEIRAQREPTVEDLDSILIEEGCGFRPARDAGVRLEVEWMDIPRGEGQVPVIYNYG